MVVFTQHAEDKLEERWIPRGLVLKALAHPDFTRPSYGNRTIAFKRFGRRYLLVIFKREGKTTVVVTKYWISKVGI